MKRPARNNYLKIKKSIVIEMSQKKIIKVELVKKYKLPLFTIYTIFNDKNAFKISTCKYNLIVENLYKYAVINTAFSLVNNIVTIHMMSIHYNINTFIFRFTSEKRGQ